MLLYHKDNDLKTVPVLLKLIDIILWFTVTERLVQRAELPLQGCSSVLQRLRRFDQLMIQIFQPPLTGCQVLLKFLLRVGTEIMEVADLQGQGILTSSGTKAQQTVSGRVKLRHLPLLPVNCLQQSLESKEAHMPRLIECKVNSG